MPAQIATSSFSILNTLSGSFPCQFTFHFSKTCQESNHQRCHLAQCFSADQTIQRPEMNAVQLKIMQTVDDLDLRPAQPVQLGDYQFIVGFQHSQTRLEMMALLNMRPTADDRVDDDGAPCVL